MKKHFSYQRVLDAIQSLENLRLEIAEVNEADHGPMAMPSPQEQNLAEIIRWLKEIPRP